MSSTLGLAGKAGLETKPAGICRRSCLLGVRRNSVAAFGNPWASARRKASQFYHAVDSVSSCSSNMTTTLPFQLSLWNLCCLLSGVTQASSKDTHTTRCVALDGLPTGQTTSISQVCCSRVPHVQPASVDIFEPCDSGGGPAHPAKPQRCQRRHGAMTRNFTHHDGLM